MTDNTPTTKQEEGGLVTVPREPTWEMLNAAVDLTNAGSGMSWVNRSPQKLFAQAWSAMLAAAPATPPHNEDGLRKAREADMFMQIANQAVERNLNEDGSPKYDSAQGYACAMDALRIAFGDAS